MLAEEALGAASVLAEEVLGAGAGAGPAEPCGGSERGAQGKDFFGASWAAMMFLDTTPRMKGARSVSGMPKAAFVTLARYEEGRRIRRYLSFSGSGVSSRSPPETDAAGAEMLPLCRLIVHISALGVSALPMIESPMTHRDKAAGTKTFARMPAFSRDCGWRIMML